MVRKIILPVFFLFYFFEITAQPAALPAFVTDSLDAYVARGMERWQGPGVGVGNGGDGRPVRA